MLTRVSGWVYGQYFLPLYDFFFAIFQIAIFLVKALFLIGSGLGVAAAGYVLYKNESKRTVWGWVAVVWGIDTCSRVLLQKLGIDVEPIISRDPAAYRDFYQTYRAKHEAEEKAEKEEIAKAQNGQAGPVSYFDGTGAGLFGTYLLYALLTIITCGFAAPWLNCAIQRWRTRHMVVDGNTFQYIGYNIMQFLLLVVTFGLAYPWTHKMILRWQTKHQLINNDRLIYDGTALGMLVRALVVILTLVIPFAFLASPWAYCWLWRYQYSHTHVDHSSAE
ncbi:hypothetical protein ACIA39_05665 [Lactobacillus delbrueckii subsp. bulgaricus]|uniref:hypothetical protein n=1 Tax=Lactobacillus delbrueckii TaxID=1584 RepID=UPI0037CB5876